ASHAFARRAVVWLSALATCQTRAPEVCRRSAARSTVATSLLDDVPVTMPDSSNVCDGMLTSNVSMLYASGGMRVLRPARVQRGEVRGIGAIPVGPPDPTTVAFDVKSGASGVHGVFTASDVAGESLTTDPTVNPANSFTAFRASSGFCSVSSHGAEFDATGVL